jgi:hypothetical protein
MILRMLTFWRRRRSALEAVADDWIDRHGRHAASLARMRSIDAYLLGDLAEQERWSRVREMIEDKLPEQRLE